jgi:hypothetical protein
LKFNDILREAGEKLLRDIEDLKNSGQPLDIYQVMFQYQVQLQKQRELQLQKQKEG